MMLGGSVERETLVDFENVIVVAEISLVKELGEIMRWIIRSFICVLF